MGRALEGRFVLAARRYGNCHWGKLSLISSGFRIDWLTAIFFYMTQAGIHYLLDAVEFFVLRLKSGLDDSGYIVEPFIDTVETLVHQMAQV
jgi:hypothetical protein